MYKNSKQLLKEGILPQGIIFKVKSYCPNEKYNDRDTKKYQICINIDFIYISNDNFLYRYCGIKDIEESDYVFHYYEILEMPNEKNEKLYNRIMKINDI